MEKLLASRTKPDEQLISVGNISPQKYGKSAYCNLQYTPSKLADNVLYKEVTNLKKVQQQTNKIRQFEAINDCLMDKLKYVQQQKNVIINSLNQQIAVYKKIIAEMQHKNEQRIKELQRKYKEQITRIIKDKQEEVKFIQSQKQLLEETIEQLQGKCQSLQNTINNHQKDVADIKFSNQKYQKQIQNLNYKIRQKQQKIKQDSQRARLEIEDLHRKILDTEILWKNQLRDALHRKQLDIEAMQKLHHEQMIKLQNLRDKQAALNKDEINQIIRSYEKQIKRLNQLINQKERALDTLSYENSQEKAKNLSVTKTYQTELTELTTVKMLSNQLQRQNVKLRDLLLESSLQLQRCRDQFLILQRQNGTLRIKLKGSEQQAKTWRQSYYVNRRA